MKVVSQNLSWFAQDCSLMLNEEKDSSEVFFFKLFLLFCLFLFTIHILTLREKKYRKITQVFFFFLCVKLAAGDYCVFMLIPSVLSSRRRMLPWCGGMTPSVTGRRCARWWGASTLEPSPSTELWATSPQESTGSKRPATS